MDCCALVNTAVSKALQLSYRFLHTHTSVKKFVFSDVKQIIFTSTDDGWTFCWTFMCCSAVLHQTGNICQQLLTLSSFSVLVNTDFIWFRQLPVCYFGGT